MKHRLALPPLLAALLLVACEGEQISTDAGSGTDTGVPVDAGPGDTGSPDSGLPADTGAVDTGVVNPGEGEIDLGAVTLTNGISDVLTFDLPADTVAFMVTIAGIETNTYLVHTLDGPTGNLVTNIKPADLDPLEEFFLGPFPAQYKSPNRVVADEGVAGALFPNNPLVVVSAGTYQMQVQGAVTQDQMPATDTPSVKVHYKTGSIATGRIDISVHLSGAGGITAQNAETNPLMAGAVTDLRAIYQAAGVTIGTVSYYDIDARYRTLQSIQGAGSDLHEMFKLTAGKGPGLHYFFVDRIEGGLGGMIGGVAGGLPGPPGTQGSIGSGVAVALEATMGDPATVAHVMGHEGGHWLGLSHTVEFIGTEDQMPDTPPGQASDTHLMYPAVGGGQQISAGQADVMRRHIETINQ